MPVTAGHVPGLTSGLRRVPMDPGRFHSGRWFLLVEGALVSLFGIAGLVSAALHPHAGPTGAPVFGLTATPLYSGILLAFGVAAIACSWHRRAAITVTALSAVAYTILLFVSSVATTGDKPTPPLGFHAAEVLLNGILAVVNLALLMWLIPDELGDEVWAPRRRRGRDRRQPPAPETPAAPPAPAAATTVSSTPKQEPAAKQSPPRQSPATKEPPAQRVTTQQPAVRAASPAPPWRVLAAVALVLAVVGVVVWMRRH
ncbi:DUF4383 domain-containing protein [Mycobacterium paraense]|jgi:hypothetical protein|uniref:DUF4383 domain-containing protein n=1 Tax=Mycobacterium paraense TaxID=767916 RepID=UPI000A1627AD|nr:DUF4383 domain-containing protein [Mycobacterium paraense]MCV7441524.1 DUF4383 domain-containing protein [Mycobacterium paraense]